MTGSRSLVEAYMAAYNDGDLDRVAELVTPGYVHRNNGLALTIEQFRRGATWFRQVMPDFRLQVEDVIEEGDRSAVRWTARGTHSATMFGEAPTGRSIVLHGITIYRVEDGRIAEDWESMDEHDLRVQVGAAEA